MMQEITIYVDADGWPVKEDVCGIARRRDHRATVVSNKRIRIAMDEPFIQVIVGAGYRLTASP